MTDDGYDLNDKDTVISLLKTHVEWCKESPSHEVSFGSYGPTLSQVIESAISMIGEKPKRNCDMYESEDEAKEAYEQLFYGTFHLKNCKDTIVAPIPGSPEFSTWLMTPIDDKQQKFLSDKKEAKLSEMKSVSDVINVMTGVPPKAFYYNSEVRELGHRIEELYELEKKHYRDKNAKRNCDRFNTSEEAFEAYVKTFTKEELRQYEHGEGDFADDYNVKMRFFEWLYKECK